MESRGISLQPWRLQPWRLQPWKHNEKDGSLLGYHEKIPMHGMTQDIQLGNLSTYVC